MDNFEELKKKVETYPNSSLFVPLAEEHKNRGELDEAIDVLIKGLGRQPSYISARVALAKVYIEKGMKAEAVVELEKVVEVSPDNFLAHKKLAETYCQLGRREDTISQYNEVLKLNPEDAEALSALKKLKEGGHCGEGDASADMAAELEALSLPPEEDAGGGTGADDMMATLSPFDVAGNDDAEKFDTAAFAEQSEPFEVTDSAASDEETWDEEFDTAAFAEQSEPFEVTDGIASDEETGDEEFDTAAFAEQSEPFEVTDSVASDEETWDVGSSDMDMGGLELEPDGVFGDEESGEISMREEDSGLDIETGSTSGWDEATPQENESEIIEAEASDDTEASTGEVDILEAAEKVGFDILNEPIGEESFVPSGGDEEGLSGEYSGESLIDDYSGDDGLVAAAPGLETFGEEWEEPREVPVDDKTVAMREPLAGMEDSIAEEADEPEEVSIAEPYEDSTVIMEAAAWDEEEGEVLEAVPEAMEVEEGEVLEAVPEAMAVEEGEVLEAVPEAMAVEEGEVLEAVPEAMAVEEGEVLEAVPEAVAVEEDETVLMQAPVWETQEPVVEEVAEDETFAGPAMEQYVQSDEEAVYGSEPFASFDETTAVRVVAEPDAITAEPGTIGEEVVADGSNLINDPFAVPPAEHDEATQTADASSEMQRAELQIAAGEYAEAMKIYSALLSMNPEDKIVKMKMDELMMLLNVMGQGDMLYQKGLESFRTAIMRRRDELR